MKVIRKSDGKCIEVKEWRGTSDVIFSTLDMNEFYQASDLDFDLPEEKESLKLSDVKEQIDEWFESHTPEEVSQKMIEYGMTYSKKSAVIEGWVCRDKEICEHYDTDLWVGAFKPIRKFDTYWAASKATLIPLRKELFPSLTWESEPLKVRIQITPME